MERQHSWHKYFATQGDSTEGDSMQMDTEEELNL